MTNNVPYIDASAALSLSNLYTRTGIYIPTSAIPAMGPQWGNGTQPIVETLAELPLVSFQTVAQRRFNFTHVGYTNPLNPPGQPAVPGPPVLHATVEHCLVEHADYWDGRGYHIGANTKSFCAYYYNDREHHAYDNILTGVLYSLTNCYFENAGGQDVQTVQRLFEGDPENPTNCSADLEGTGGMIFMQDCMSRNAGWNYAHGRNAFALSFFDQELAEGTHAPGPHNVYLNRCFWDKSMQGTCKGLVLIQSRPQAVLEDFIGLGGDNLDQPIIKVEGSGDFLALIRPILHAGGGQNWVDISPGWASVWISGGQGNSHVKRNGVDLGPITDFNGYL